MPSEIEFQKKIIKATEHSGGYGRKWSSAYLVGVPDLILCLPEPGVFVMEVKKIEITRGSDKKRKIHTTAIQRNHLKRFEESGGLAVVGVVLDGGPRDRALLVVPWYTEQVHPLQQLGRAAYGNWPYGGHVDMADLIRRYKQSLDAPRPVGYVGRVHRYNQGDT